MLKVNVKFNFDKMTLLILNFEKINDAMCKPQLKLIKSNFKKH